MQHNTDLAKLAWFKSSYSNQNQNCVETAHLDGAAVAMRDSKDVSRKGFVSSSAAWSSFVSGVKADAFTR